MHRLLILLILIILQKELIAQVVKDSVFTLQETSIYFDNDAYLLNKSHVDSLEEFIVKNKVKNGITFDLEGHTNFIGSVEYNQILSEKRVDAIRIKLIAMGVNPSIIHTAAYGKNKPEWQNNNDGINLNRQVKIRIRKNIPLRKIGGYATADGKKLANTTITFKNKFFHVTVQTDTNGKYEVFIPEKIPVNVTALLNGYINDYLTITPNENTNPFEVKLSKIIPGSSIYITSLYFEGDKNELLPSSIESLSHLTSQIVSNRSFCFEIQGHVDAPQLKRSELSPLLLKLSMARAGFLYKHLIDHDVDRRRMFASGYGNSNMLFPRPKKDLEHVFNRRVELKIYDCKFVEEKRNKFDEFKFLDLAEKKEFKF
jgi:outer membrane protein OmpA-like peptidoglycan-associated protein